MSGKGGRVGWSCGQNPHFFWCRSKLGHWGNRNWDAGRPHHGDWFLTSKPHASGFHQSVQWSSTWAWLARILHKTQNGSNVNRLYPKKSPYGPIQTKIQRKNGHWVWMDNGHVENMVHTQVTCLSQTYFLCKKISCLWLIINHDCMKSESGPASAPPAASLFKVTSFSCKLGEMSPMMMVGIIMRMIYVVVLLARCVLPLLLFHKMVGKLRQ